MATTKKTVTVELSEIDVKQIIAHYINENKSKYGVEVCFKSEDIKINLKIRTLSSEFDSITATTNIS